MTSVSCVQVSANAAAGHLSKVPQGCEDNVPDEFRIPRATHAVFAFSNGAVGTLSHGALMHGTKYHTEFEIWCDGLKILLHDPYTDQCAVYVNDVATKFPSDDPYLTEDRVFLSAIVDTTSTNAIKSSYSDAVKTYELSYVMTHKALKTGKKN